MASSFKKMPTIKTLTALSMSVVLLSSYCGKIENGPNKPDNYSKVDFKGDLLKDYN